MTKTGNLGEEYMGRFLHSYAILATFLSLKLYEKKKYQNLQDRNRLTDLEDELIPPNPPQEGEESGEG